MEVGFHFKDWVSAIVSDVPTIRLQVLKCSRIIRVSSTLRVYNIAVCVCPNVFYNIKHYPNSTSKDFSHTTKKHGKKCTGEKISVLEKTPVYTYIHVCVSSPTSLPRQVCRWNVSGSSCWMKNWTQISSPGDLNQPWVSNPVLSSPTRKNLWASTINAHTYYRHMCLPPLQSMRMLFRWLGASSPGMLTQ